MTEINSLDHSDYYYDYYYEEVVQNEELKQVCHEFEYSILFFLVVAVIGASFMTYGIILVTKRRNGIFYGFDILFSLIFFCAAIR